jgi:hypothetical protein
LWGEANTRAKRVKAGQERMAKVRDPFFSGSVACNSGLISENFVGDAAFDRAERFEALGSTGGIEHEGIGSSGCCA